MSCDLVNGSDLIQWKRFEQTYFVYVSKSSDRSDFNKLFQIFLPDQL